ncbi:MAG: zinc-dependent peptidase [Verrucomicrobiae bacterium]|nr:zinc-dependent peptidase [Verrucomicrobiae bacterium]
MPLLSFLQNIRRNWLRKQPFPPAWMEILVRHMPLCRRLPPEDQLRLQQDIQIFLAEKNFEGCNGLEIDDEIRVTIAATACLLSLHLDSCCYPGLESIVVYPDSFVVKTERPGPAGTVIENHEPRDGEAWPMGTIVLSWAHVRRETGIPGNGRNVVLHEFAHWLDQQDGDISGSPELKSRARYRSWARILGREYLKLIQAIEAGESTLIDEYGATDPAEFFAVATECFFELPLDLRQFHPTLYRELQTFYRQDPAQFY